MYNLQNQNCIMDVKIKIWLALFGQKSPKITIVHQIIIPLTCDSSLSLSLARWHYGKFFFYSLHKCHLNSETGNLPVKMHQLLNWTYCLRQNHYSLGEIFEWRLQTLLYQGTIWDRNRKMGYNSSFAITLQMEFRKNILFLPISKDLPLTDVLLRTIRVNFENL